MSDALARLAVRVRRESGVRLGTGQRASLRAAVLRADGVVPEAFERRLEDPLRAGVLMSRLIDEVTVKETFLFRHPAELAVLDWHGALQRARMAGRRGVRVWCAACSTGQEAYTLAVLALEAFWPDPAPVEILATDIAASALAGAGAGRYGARSARELPAEARRRWFVADGNGVRVVEAARRHVRFAQHNLVSDRFPPAGEPLFDFVTCRNVLIYFDRQLATRTVAKLDGTLFAGGHLLLGAADRLAAGSAAPAHPRAAVVSIRGSAKPSRSAGPRAKSLAAAPDAPSCLAEGREARGRGDARAAVGWLRRALYLDPAGAEAGLELALAHTALGDLTATRRALRRALHEVMERGCVEPGDEELAAECSARLSACDPA